MENLGSLYHKMGKYEKELQCYNKALEIDPEKAEALMSKGTTLFKIYDNPKEALKLMLKSFEVSNDFNKAFIAGYFWISEVYQSLNDYENAGIWTSKGLKVDPGDDYLLNQQAHIFCKVWKNQTEKIDDTRSFLESYLFSRGDVPNKYPIIQEISQIRLYQKEPFMVIWEDLLEPNVKLFENVILDDVMLLFENGNEIFEGIRSFGRYEEFRATSTLEKYHAIILERLPIDGISSKIIHLIDIALAYSYGLFFTSLSKVTKNESFETEKDIPEPIFNFLSYALPKISKLIYEEIGKLIDPEVKRECCVLMSHISTVEIRLQLEDVIPRFNLNPEPLIEVFTNP
ncbi:MAG: tetratricopeptide repeat protein [Bacteroidota bacterium]